MDQRDKPDRIEPTLAAERMENIDATQPMEPTERKDPAEPIDRIDPVEHTERIEPADPMLRIEPAEPSDRSEPCVVLIASILALAISGLGRRRTGHKWRTAGRSRSGPQPLAYVAHQPIAAS